MAQLLTALGFEQVAVPVGLMNGERLVSLLVENDIGVERTSYDLIELPEAGDGGEAASGDE